MARPKSVILSPAEKKQKAADLKSALRADKVTLREIKAEMKAIDKTYKSTMRELTKSETAVNKALVKAQTELEALAN